MQQALRRPKGAPDTQNHIELAAWEAVDIEEYEPGDKDLLRCLAVACHGMVRPRHKPFPEHKELQCFVHFRDEAQPVCPFYKVSRKKRPQRVMIEVYGEILAQLRAAGTLDDPKLVGDQLRIDIERDGHPVVSVVYLDPKRARQLTDAIEGQELFVVTVTDLRKINRETLAKALARGPIRVVSPNRDGDGRSESHLCYGIGSTRIRQGLVGLQTAMVDWEALFKIELASCNVWIEKPLHEALQEGLKKALRNDDLAPEGRKVLRLLAKRVLVDGAAVHKWIFKQRLDDARRFTTVGERFPRPDDLVTPAELLRVSADRVAMECISGNSILRGFYEELTRKSSEKAQRDLELARARIERLAQELAAEQEAKRVAEERAATRARGLKAAAALAQDGLEQAEGQRDEHAAAEKEALASAASLQDKLRKATAKAGSLEPKANRVDGLTQRLETATQELAAERTAKGKVGKSLDAARTSVAELTQENRKLAQQLTSANGRKEQLQMQLKSAQAGAKKQEGLVGDLKSARSVAEDRLSTQKDRIGELEETVADLRSERRHLQSKVDWSVRGMLFALAVTLLGLGLALSLNWLGRSEPARPAAEETDAPATGEPVDAIALEEEFATQAADDVESTVRAEPDPPGVSRPAAPATDVAEPAPRPGQPEPKPAEPTPPKATTQEPPQLEPPVAEPPPAPVVAPEGVPPEPTPKPEPGPASVAELLSEARQRLSASPEIAFYGKKKNELVSLVGAARAFHLAGRENRAADSLGKAIDRTNGCSEHGVADTKRSGRDWITDCTLQKEVYSLLAQAQGAG